MLFSVNEFEPRKYLHLFIKNYSGTNTLYVKYLTSPTELLQK